MSTGTPWRLTVLLVMALSTLVSAQLLIENFQYDEGDTLTNHGWSFVGEANPVTVVSPGLHYPDYPGASIGNAVSLDGAGQDVARFFQLHTDGTVYLSCMVSVSSATDTGDVFFHVMDTSRTFTHGRIFAKEDSLGNLEFGLAKDRPPLWAIFTDNDYNFNEVYALVLKYEIAPGDSNDRASLFVFESPTLPATEPASPTLGPDNRAEDPDNIGYVSLRQGLTGFAPSLTIDGIRVGQVWEDTPLPVSLSSFSALGQEKSIQLNWATASEINNLGYEVWRSDESASTYTKIADYDSHSELHGQGTTTNATQYQYTDKWVQAGKSYWYKLYDVAYDGSRTSHGPVSATVGANIVTNTDEVPASYSLFQNYPNPFNPDTQIKFGIPALDGSTTTVTVEIYNILGQRVRTLFDGEIVSGIHTLQWDATTEEGFALPGGVYIAVMRASEFSQSIKMVLIR